MKAVRINQWGQPAQIEDIARSSPASDEVLVRVHAASINPIDVIVAAGYLQAMLTVPMTAGTDFAGEVITVGVDVSHVNPGDSVYGCIALRGGTFAEYVVVKGAEVAPKPSSLDSIQAASVPLSALTAWQGLNRSLKIKAGERLLIHGVAGNVGSFAAQFARLSGVEVIGTAAAKDEAFVRSLGLNRWIDHTKTKFEEEAGEVDAVFASIGGEVIPRSFAVMKPAGRLVTTGQMAGADEAQQRGLQATGMACEASIDDLAAIARLIDAGEVKVHVTDTVPFDQFQRGFELHQDHSRGRRKVVLTL